MILAAVAVAGCDPGPERENDPPRSNAAVQAAATPLPSMEARIESTSGPGGLSSSTLAQGTFLGAGAALAPGQDVHTPRGTLAELRLGILRVRLDEDTEVRVPSPTEPAIVLSRGGLVVVSDVESTIDVLAQDDRVHATAGEVLVRAGERGRHVAVLRGRAEVETGGQTIALQPGQSVDTPLPAEAPRALRSSLEPLRDTGWSHAFDEAVRIGDAVPRGIGSLTARTAGTSNEQQALRLIDERVTVNISGRLAHTEIEQAFFNDRPAVLEGIYRFPLPGDATIADLGLLVGDRWMQGEIVEKQRARNIFQQIVDATVPRDPALLEWERGNLFKLRVFPIPGRGERRVRLGYTQILPVVGGKLRYRYPIGGSGATATPIDRFAFTVNVEGRALAAEEREAISTPMLALERRDRADGGVELFTERRQFVPTFDLGVDVPVARERTTVHTATHRDRDGQAYFMITLQPELDLPASERSTDFAFVLDRSHSTTPELWSAAQGMVLALGEMLGEGDRMTVLACDTACDEWQGGLTERGASRLVAMEAFLEGQELAGASDLGGMLIEARSALDRGARGSEQVVVYLGDGVPSSGEMSTDGLATLVGQALPRTRVVALALGARSDLVTLGAVARATGGDLVQVDARDDLRSLVRELRLRAAVPALRNVQFETPPGLASVRQHGATSLRSGDAVVLAGKLDHTTMGDVVLRGWGPQGSVEQRFPVRLELPVRGEGSPVDAHLPRTWAAMEIAELTRTRGAAAKDEIVALSKAYTVLSRHTALLVLENDAMYREFNVVRTAAATDRWAGAPASETETISGGLVDAAAARPTTTTPAGPPPPAPAPDRRRDAFEGASGASRSPAPEEKREIANKDVLDDPFAGDPDIRDFASAPAHDEDAEAEPAQLGDDDSDTPTVNTGGSGRGAPFDSVAPKPATTVAKKVRTDGAKGAPSPSKQAEAEHWPFEERTSRRGWFRMPRLVIASADATIGARTAARIDALERAATLTPAVRSAHTRLVQAAMRAHHPRSFEFARAWAEADPEHTGALTALADVLARDGDPLALRAYASVVDVRPFSADLHGRLAEAYASKGDVRRACSHRRAQVSIAPANASHAVALADCLARAGQAADARAAELAFVEAAASPRERSEREQALRKGRDGLVDVRLHAHPDVRATLTWTGEDDLDLALVDARGRRLSVLHGNVRVREGDGREELTLASVRDAVFIEVTRNRVDDEALARPVLASLIVKTPNGRRTIDVPIDTGARRIARVAWTR